MAALITEKGNKGTKGRNGGDVLLRHIAFFVVTARLRSQQPSYGAAR